MATHLGGQRRTWRRFLQGLLVMLCLGTVNFAASASQVPSQDYINGMLSEQTKALGDRVGNLEKVLYFVLASTFGVLITNIMGLRNQGRVRQQVVDDRAADQYRADQRDRIVDRRSKARGRDD